MTHCLFTINCIIIVDPIVLFIKLFIKLYYNSRDFDLFLFIISYHSLPVDHIQLSQPESPVTWNRINCQDVNPT